MGTWSDSITGNDTARDLLSEYRAAFFSINKPWYNADELLVKAVAHE